MASSTKLSPYPVVVEIDPPERQNRLSVFFRPLLAVPHIFIIGLLNYSAEVVVFVAWLMILVAGRFPKGLWNFVCGYLRWSMRINAYTLLLTGRYPPFDIEDVPEYPARLRAETETEGRSRLTVLFRLILVIPHVFVLALVGILGAIVMLVAWVAGVIAGRVPGVLHNFLAGLLRWNTRVTAYILLLTDRYPPFSLT